MDADRPETEEGRSPTARDLLPLLPIVVLVSWFVRTFEWFPWVSTRTSVAIAAASAALLGLPALFWALDHGYRRLGALVALGGVVGLLPLLLIVFSATIGLLVRVGPEVTRDMLQAGAPMPAMGLMPWRTFLRTEIPAAITGALSGGVYWLLLVAPRRWMRRP